jgi:hypothetical protein
MDGEENILWILSYVAAIIAKHDHPIDTANNAVIDYQDSTEEKE